MNDLPEAPEELETIYDEELHKDLEKKRHQRLNNSGRRHGGML